MLTKEYFEVQNSLFSSFSWCAYGPFAAMCLKQGTEENNVQHCRPQLVLELALLWFIYVRGSVEESKPVPLIPVLIKV